MGFLWLVVIWDQSTYSLIVRGDAAEYFSVQNVRQYFEQIFFLMDILLKSRTFPKTKPRTNEPRIECLLTLWFFRKNTFLSSQIINNINLSLYAQALILHKMDKYRRNFFIILPANRKIMFPYSIDGIDYWYHWYWILELSRCPF